MDAIGKPMAAISTAACIGVKKFIVGALSIVLPGNEAIYIFDVRNRVSVPPARNSLPARLRRDFASLHGWRLAGAFPTPLLVQLL
jgi:hypothetical protein